MRKAKLHNLFDYICTMKYLILIPFFFLSCVKYQVVQEVDVHMYHMHSPKHGVEIIITKDSLELGKWYKLKNINTINIDKTR